MQLARTALTAALAGAVLVNLAVAAPATAQIGAVRTDPGTVSGAARLTAWDGDLAVPLRVTEATGPPTRLGARSLRRRTTTALSVNPSSGSALQHITLTAAVRRLGHGRHPGRGSGLVVFRDGGRVIGRTALRGSGRRPGLAVLHPYLRPGGHVLTAHFRPRRGQHWWASVSPSVSARYHRVPGCVPVPASAGTMGANSCRVSGSVRVRVPTGPLMVSSAWPRRVVFDVPERGSGPVVLAPIRHRVLQVTVTDLRGGQPGWSLAVAASRLRAAGRSSAPAALSLRRVHLIRYPGNTLGTASAPIAVRSIEALSRQPRTIAVASPRHSRGTVTIVARLRLAVPAGTPPGRYALRLSLTLT